jgi:predicted O-methyltransferase YrrM
LVANPYASLAPGDHESVLTARHLAKRAVRLGANQKVSELTQLVRLLKRRRLDTVVEIGTARGGTFATWCAVAEPEAVLVSIDLPGGMYGSGYTEQEAERYRSWSQPGQELHFLRADSHAETTRDALAAILRGRLVDLLMIDGDHTYEGVAADYRMYSRFVADGGLIAFHDILPHPQVPDCQVDRLWAELRGTGQNMEFTDPDNDRGWGQWGGIGVLVHRA